MRLPDDSLPLRFSVLLAAIFLFLIIAPLAEWNVLGVHVPQLFASIIYVSAVLTVGGTRHRLWIAVGLAALNLLLTGRNVWALDALSEVLDVGLLAFTFSGVLTYVFYGKIDVPDSSGAAAGRVTLDIILAGICVYLLVGLTFARMYHLAAVLARTPALAGASAAGTVGPTPMRDLVYFSFCTLTSAGSGDLYPAMRIVRSLATVEAVVGQLFLGIFIGRLVGLSTSNAANEEIKKHVTEEVADAIGAGRGESSDR